MQSEAESGQEQAKLISRGAGKRPARLHQRLQHRLRKSAPQELDYRVDAPGAALDQGPPAPASQLVDPHRYLIEQAARDQRIDLPRADAQIDHRSVAQVRVNDAMGTASPATVQQRLQRRGAAEVPLRNTGLTHALAHLRAPGCWHAGCSRHSEIDRRELR